MSRLSARHADMDRTLQASSSRRSTARKQVAPSGHPSRKPSHLLVCKVLVQSISFIVARELCGLSASCEKSAQPVLIGKAWRLMRESRPCYLSVRCASAGQMQASSKSRSPGRYPLHQVLLVWGRRVSNSVLKPPCWREASSSCPNALAGVVEAQ